MTRQDLIGVAQFIASNDPAAGSRIKEAGAEAYRNWRLSTPNAREAACEVAMEVQVLTEVHAEVRRQKRDNA